MSNYLEEKVRRLEQRLRHNARQWAMKEAQYQQEISILQRKKENRLKEPKELDVDELTKSLLEKL